MGGVAKDIAPCHSLKYDEILIPIDDLHDRLREFPKKSSLESVVRQSELQ